MEPKTYLSEIRHLKRMADTLERKRETLIQQAGGLKAITYDKDKVQTSQANLLEEAVIRIADLDTKLAAVTKRYTAAVAIRTEQIMALNKPEYRELLLLRYVDDGKEGKGNTLDEIAERMGYTYSWTRKLHGRALQEFGKQYLNNEHKRTF